MPRGTRPEPVRGRVASWDAPSPPEGAFALYRPAAARIPSGDRAHPGRPSRCLRVILGAFGLALAATATPTAVAGVAEGIRVDGVLGEPAWARAAALGPLLQ